MTIPNIPLSTFLKLPDISEFEPLKFLEAKDKIIAPGSYCQELEITAKEIEKMKWGQVMSMRISIAENDTTGIIQAIRQMFRLSEDQIKGMKIVQFYYALNWIIQETERLIHQEKNIGTSDTKWTQAAGNTLNKYLHFGVMKGISEQFGYKLEEIEELQYDVVFLIISYNADYAHVQKRYNKLMQPK